MKIGVAGRIGMSIALFAAFADATSWIVRAIDNYPFAFYRLTDAYLPVIFVFGVVLLLPSVSVAIQNKRTASLARFPLTAAGPLPVELRQGAGNGDASTHTPRRTHMDAEEIPPPALAFVPSPSRRRLFTKVARLCLLGAVLVYVGMEFWRATRTSVLLNVPMALARGHNLTPAFRVPLQVVGSLELALANYNTQTCNLGVGSQPPVRWTLLKLGRPVATGTFLGWQWSRDITTDQFKIPSGTYRLDLDPLADCATDKWGDPRIRVRVDWKSTALDQYADLLLYLLAGVGIALLLWPEVRETEELSLQGEPRATFRGVAQLGHKVQPFVPVVRLLFNLRLWAVGWFGVVAPLLFILGAVAPLTPKGLWVHLPKPGTYAPADELWNPPLVVRVDAQGDFYFDDRPIAASQLGPVLLRTLALRSDWTVYVDGAPDAKADDVIHVVDAIRGIPSTKVSLVTPSMKEEKPRTFATPPCEIELLEWPQRPYPPKKNRHGVYSPLVSFVVTERGEVSHPRVLRSSQDAEIDAWAVDTVRKWKYSAKPGCGQQVLEREFDAYFW